MKLSLCSTEYKFEDGDPVIHLFCRDINGKRHIIKDRSFSPYFYIWEGDYQFFYRFSQKNQPSFSKNEIEILGTPSVNIKNIDNKPMRKIIVRKPSSVRVLRNELKKKGIPTFEADILFPLRYLIDKDIKSGIEYNEDLDIIKPFNKAPSNLKTIYLDIEVLSEKIPDLRDANVSICTIGIYDTLEKRYYQLYLVPPNSLPLKIDYTKVINKEPRLVESRWFTKEEDLISFFLKLVKLLEPDVILTFTTFDILYIIRRCNNLGINYRKLSPLYIVSAFKDGRVKVSGVQVLDLAEMYRIVIGEPKWETLEAVSQRELGYGRIHYKEQVSKMFFEDYKKVLYRNIRDVELIKELDKTCNLLTYFDTVRLVVGCNLSDTMYASRIADIMYLREVHNKVILPSKQVIEKKTYSGAVVLESIKGVHDNVLVVDFSEMYPSIIITFNISYNTYSKEGDINIDNKYFFRSKPIGWTPNILNTLRPIRWRIKKSLKNIENEEEYRRKKAMSDGYKAIINALYGMYGYSGAFEYNRPASRLYNIDIAECITYLGRTILTEGLVPSLKELGYNIIYGDTDSIFIPLKTKYPEEISSLISRVNSSIKKFIKERWKVKAKLEVDIDKIFNRLILFGVKKRYKGITDKGEVIVVGLEQIRKDTAEITADIQDTLGKYVLEDKPKNVIIDYIRKIVSEYRDYPLTYISIPKRLRKKYGSYKGVKKRKGIPEHVKAFKRGIEMLGEELVEGERFYLIHVLIPKKVKNKIIMFPENKKKKKMMQTTLMPVIRYESTAIGYKDPNKLVDYRINYDKMFKLTVKDKINPLLDLLNIKWDDIVEDRK